MRRPQFANGEIYHVYNRGVEKRKVFLDEEDRFRFIHDLFEFNDEAPAQNLYYKAAHFTNPQSYEIGSRKIKTAVREPRKPLVAILAFCLMPNHFHLLMQQKKTGGITTFMQKLGVGYAMYFNQKQQRVGPLFQGKFKAIHVGRDSHFIHLPFYIHLNPLDLRMPEWRKRELSNYHEALRFLETYRWSSHLDYLGKNNFPSVTQRDLLLRSFGGPEEYKKAVTDWLRYLDLESITHLTLE